ncbi:MAG: DUF4199 domain-containing protein [Usitatibacteraceae bacterium]
MTPVAGFGGQNRPSSTTSGVHMRKIVLTFGLISGAILSAMMLLTVPFVEQIGFDKGAIIGYTTMVLAFLMVYFGVRSYRDNVAGGSVTFGRALLVGFMITAVASVCYVATWQLVYYKLLPDSGEKYVAHALEKAKKKGATEAQLAAQKKEMAEFLEMYKNPLVNIALTFLEPLPVGLVFTLVTAGVLSRKRRTTGGEIVQA